MCYLLGSPSESSPSESSPAPIADIGEAYKEDNGKSSKNQGLTKIFACTTKSCPSVFSRKHDWKKHEEEFHDHQRSFTCTIDDCKVQLYSRERFNRHHQQKHGCKDCSHVDDCEKPFQPKKYAWACGWCLCTLDSWTSRIDHIATHYKAGKKKKDWDDSLVIKGLLNQPYVKSDWLRLIGISAANWQQMRCLWSTESVNLLRKSLELRADEDGSSTGMQLAQSALAYYLYDNDPTLPHSSLRSTTAPPTGHAIDLNVTLFHPPNNFEAGFASPYD